VRGAAGRRLARLQLAKNRGRRWLADSSRNAGTLAR
jgi:hypothetical protein